MMQVDLFFYRDPEEAKEQEEEAAVVTTEHAAGPNYSVSASNDQWNDGWVGVDATAAPPVAADPADTWAAGQGQRSHSLQLLNSF